MKKFTFATKIFSILFLCLGCGEKESSFSLLPDSNIFYQNDATLNAKIDILFLVDDSGSMATSQDNLAANFGAFIRGFVEKNLDYRIAVGDTGAWRTAFGGNLAYSRFRDGATNRHSGIFVVDPTTPNLFSVFQNNVRLGTAGTGDERPLSSFEQVLSNSQNTGFLRTDSHLSIVILTDEDDFSRNSSQSNAHNYNDPLLYPISRYPAFLDQLTNSSGATRRYSVNTVAILDQACLNILSPQASERIIARRVIELVDSLEGIKGNLCGDFAQSLDEIANRTLELSTQFYLNREPVIETIEVFVNDQLVPPAAVNGWTYNANANSIVFHGTAVPVQGSKIVVNFDPVSIK